MAESKLSIAERHVGDVTVLALTGQMMVDDGDLVFRRQVHDLINRGRAKILVDLSSVTQIDSSGVGMLAAKLKTTQEAGGNLKLLHVTSRGQRLFGLMKLGFAFETFEDEEEALRSFA